MIVILLSLVKQRSPFTILVIAFDIKKMIDRCFLKMSLEELNDQTSGIATITMVSFALKNSDSYETTQKDLGISRYNTQWLAWLCQRGSQCSFSGPVKIFV